MIAPLKKPITICVTVDGSTVFCVTCPTCRRLFTSEGTDTATSHATTCCDPRCRDCGLTVPAHRARCVACELLREREKEARLFGEATKTTPEAYGDGWVHLDTEGLRTSDYFASVTDALDWCLENGQPRPAYVWGCTTMAFSMDAESVIDAALDEHHEDAHDHIDDARGLQTLLDAWCATQNVVSYFVDYDVAIVVPPAPPVAAAPVAGASEGGGDVF